MKAFSNRLDKLEEQATQMKEASEPIIIIREIVERADVIDCNTIWRDGVPLKVVETISKKVV